MGSRPIIGAPLNKAWLLASQDLSQLLKVAPQLRSALPGVLSATAGLGATVLQLLLSIIVSGVILTNARAAYELSRSLAIRLFGEKGPEFQDLVGTTMRSVTFGIIGVAIIQTVCNHIVAKLGISISPNGRKESALTMPQNSREKYVLSTGEQASERLRLLHDIFGPGTQGLLRTAGLTAGMRVAEIGCGTGLVSMWMAEEVGTDGRVTAVDASAEQLQVAERCAESAKLKNISYHQAGAYDTGLPANSFDLVYSRFLLCHLAEPKRALIEMQRVLKPGGLLVCEDHDDGGIFTEPPTRAYRRLVEISDVVNRAHSLDSHVGLKLPGLVLEAGFTKPEVHVDQIAVLRGPAKRFWELTLREAAAAIQAAGASTADELESIYREMQTIAEDDSVLLMVARVTQVWAGK